MNIKNLLAAAILAIFIVFVLGASILATSGHGTQSDPLITLSYLNEQYKTMILNELNAELDRKSDDLNLEIDSKIDSLQAELEALPSSDSSDKTHSSIETLSVVSLTNGQIVTCSVGAEIMPRIGSVAAVGSTPALVNTTAGIAISADTSLTANNLYVVTIEGNGIVAAADNVKVLIKGDFTISG